MFIVSIGTLLLMVLIYFAGVSRGSFKAKQDKIQVIADKYHKELNMNSSLMERFYPKLLLNAGILSLDKDSEVIRTLRVIERRHLKSPFVAYPDIELKQARSFLVEWQKRNNKEK